MTNITNLEPVLPPPSCHMHGCLTSWFNSLKRYIQESDDIHSLKLGSMKLKIWDVVFILKSLANSQIAELDISENDLENQLGHVSKLLTQTNIRKLNVSSCCLKTHDILSLIKILKETQITDLDVSNNRLFFFKHDGKKFVSYLVESQVTRLSLANCLVVYNDENALVFIKTLRYTSLTHLNLKRGFISLEISPNTFLSLFSELKHTSVTHLCLAGCYTGHCDLSQLGDSFRHSRLDLSDNCITDANVDDLLQAIIGSKITRLSLAFNEIKGNNNLSLFLKETQITSLDLSKNHRIQYARMFSFPHFLVGSSVEVLKLSDCGLSDMIGVPLMRSLRLSRLTDLDISGNEFTSVSIKAFAEIVKDTAITMLNVSSSLVDELGLLLIGELSVRSKLKHLDVSSRFCRLGHQPFVVAAFLEELTKSHVTSLNISLYGLNKSATKLVYPVLARAQLTRLNLNCSEIGDSVLSLAVNLKFTSITHLSLAQNNISDVGAKALAECLKQTQIFDLNLSCNKITCDGATALALFLKDATVFNLKLNENEIGSRGLEALAEHIKPNCITSLEVSGNHGNVFVVETVTWNNRRRVQQLISAFKRIASETTNKVLQSGELADNVDAFLDDCLSSYKIVTEHPSSAGILARENCTTLPRDQITKFLSDTFPQQFAWFVASHIEADISEHVNFLRSLDDLGLSRIVELLLLNRPVYTIDEAYSILHPYVYTLLSKYKLPICNLGVDPQGVERIVKYFTTFADIEGAADVVHMLKTARPS